MVEDAHSLSDIAIAVGSFVPNKKASLAPADCEANFINGIEVEIRGVRDEQRGLVDLPEYRRNQRISGNVVERPRLVRERDGARIRLAHSTHYPRGKGRVATGICNEDLFARRHGCSLKRINRASWGTIRRHTRRCEE